MAKRGYQRVCSFSRGYLGISSHAKLLSGGSSFAGNLLVCLFITIHSNSRARPFEVDLGHVAMSRCSHWTLVSGALWFNG